MHGSLLRSGVLQMLVATLLGLALGYWQPHVAAHLRPLGDGFVKLVGMNISVVVFILVVSGIAGLHDHKQSVRIGTRTLIYFEVLALLSLLTGVLLALLLQPGADLLLNPGVLTDNLTHVTPAFEKSFDSVAFLMGIIPSSFVDAFMQGSNTLQVLFLAVLFGVALARSGEHGEPLRTFFEVLAQALFGVLGLILRLAPLAALGAIAFTIGRYGLSSMMPLARLVLTLYLASLLFVVVVFGVIARLSGVSLFKLLRYIKEELLLVLLTTSSLAALPSLIVKMERLGCAPGVVRLTLPAGNALNLNGSNIYLTVAALFIAQAAGVDLSAGQLGTLLVIAMFTSKGASAVTGSSFITLAATLSALQVVPLEGVALLLSIERLMKCRSLTNLIGNCVACLAIAGWEGAIDRQQLARELDR
jgi:aerobic C4-dicarboxylate transport protein